MKFPVMRVAIHYSMELKGTRDSVKYLFYGTALKEYTKTAAHLTIIVL